MEIERTDLWSRLVKEMLGRIGSMALKYTRYRMSDECPDGAGSSVVLCDNLDGWEAQEGENVCILTADSC